MLVKSVAKNHWVLYTLIRVVIHVFIEAGTPFGTTLLKYSDGSVSTPNPFVNRLLNLVYPVILFTTFLARFIQTVVAGPSIRWTDVWFRFRVLFTTTCLEAPRGSWKNSAPALGSWTARLDWFSRCIFSWIPLPAYTYRYVSFRIVWPSRRGRGNRQSRAAMPVEKPAEQ